MLYSSTRSMALAFVPARTSLHPTFPLVSRPSSPQTIRTHCAVFASQKSTASNPVEITFPTPDEAASMGIRDWPQTFHATSWTESVSEGQIATRYVLSGTGRVNIDYFDDNARQSQRKEGISPGTLVEVDGEATLNWEVDGDDGMIILTPGFEEQGKLALVLGCFVVFCAWLLAGSGGF
ncbi:hypothetical protein HJC23_008919 [Cyclotella cryptica]|uniref:Uncharacterized protein n=1 Tax=Cyclotella cryptica TaxID=29204 RepID=A0ABD3Q3F9_9STRA|eukprot:CCRYP_009596-RA/>CCRYP_009596-RA protein AED:0.17 eAED:0.16 QI:0/-1/0/1/-1/1/1/0/178